MKGPTHDGIPSAPSPNRCSATAPWRMSPTRKETATNEPHPGRPVGRGPGAIREGLVSDETRTVDGHEIEFSNLDKVLFPDAGITKGDVVDYYERIADVMLPHMEDRIVSMHRWPDGIDGGDFYQKDVPDHFPDWIRSVEVDKEDGTLRQVVVDDRATLVYLAQQACLTPHVWLSRTDARRKPDRMIFDFDPSDDWEEAFDEVRCAARRLRSLLEDA